ncbi:MAG TPA: di-heme oxidoredictase family protein [Steroidobacteraceae bacterium]|nr:di-heme oxidoredictase family protein [Steroidobacteraceae bacterium]
MSTHSRRHLWMPLALCATLCHIGTAEAQLTDLTQAPNIENAGIVKSLEQQIGAGVGNLNTPGSSTFITARDPARAIRRGRQLFQRKFTAEQGFGPRQGSGNISTSANIGAGMIDSCAGCHGRPRGAAGFGGDVVTRPDSRDAPHLFGLGLQEMLGDEITAQLRDQRQNAINEARSRRTTVTRQLSSKGVNYGQIRAFADGRVDTSGVVGVDADLRVKPFFAQGGTTSIREFVVGAFNDEMGLQAVDLLTAQANGGARVTTPTGMVLNGATDVVKRSPVSTAQDDADQDGVVNELPQSLVDFMEFYLFNYFKPGQYQHTNNGQLGQNMLNQIGCTACHIPNMVVNRDRRIADVETRFDPQRGIFNQLFAVASLQVSENDDGSGNPTIKIPNNSSFTIRNFYADMKRHDVGPAFYERNFDGTLTRQFMTEPLWGVGSSPPYGHDGRSVNLREVILRHGGEAQASRNRFANLSESQQDNILKFLNELVLFPPDDTASNLDPGDRNNANFPQRGHGSIRLPELFNNPAELE